MAKKGMRFPVFLGLGVVAAAVVAYLYYRKRAESFAGTTTTLPPILQKYLDLAKSKAATSQPQVATLMNKLTSLI